MFVRRATLQNFRSWENLTVDLEPGVTVFEGPNGHGKTNIVEAVGYLSTLSSHRVSTDAPLIRSESDGAHVGATVINRGRELSIDVALNPGRPNRAAINGAPTRRPADILGILTTVTFAPEDLALVRGDPGERRKFLDELLTLRRPRLASVRADYEKVLRQRSALLKTAGAALRRGSDADSVLSTLDAWDAQLTEIGAQILHERIRTVHAIAPHVGSAYAEIAPASRPVAVSYRCSLGDCLPVEFTDPAREPEPDDVEVLEASFLVRLAQVREREIDRGVSLAGPHRDDMDLILGAEPAKGFASHGESWSLALSLRLGSFALLRTEDTDPVLILDDVFAELDRARREALAVVALGAEQVLITAAVADDVPQALTARRFGVRAHELGAGRRRSELIT